MDWARFWEWLLFGAGVGSFPVLARFLVEFPTHPAWKEFLSHGDLFLVTAVLAGAGVGRLIMTSRSGWWRKGPIGFACVIIFGLATWLYAVFCSGGLPAEDVLQWVATTELIFFGFSSIATSVVMGMP